MSSAKTVHKIRVIVLDDETEQIIRELKRRGHSISALFRYLLKQYYDQLVKENK